MKNIVHNADLCVVGGGMAGMCAAISAARSGIKVVLIQDRGVLGGNASSEIRMHICGAHGADMRETGILEEIILENYYQNPNLSYSMWDAVLHHKASSAENLTLLLNTACFDAECEGNKILSVKAWQSSCETMHAVNARFFADCSGDSVLAPLSGAKYRYGREARDEFGESIEPMEADKKTMGMSILFQVRETDKKQEFTPPEWAYKYPSDDDIPFREHDLSSNFRWIELGGEGDCIHDTDYYCEELLKIAYGVWDHIKNYGDHGADNYVLDRIGLLPGKRESRRYVGRYIVNQNDVEKGGKFSDVIAYAGWSMDDHFPAGINHTASYPTIFHPAPSPWGIPLGSILSENIRNLMFAGRNISVTHAALSSSRVMGTCAMLGQALGYAAAQMVKENKNFDTIDVESLQQTILDNDCFLPETKRSVSLLSKKLSLNFEVVRNGFDRKNENRWEGEKGDFLEYKSDKTFKISGIRLVFDSNLSGNYNNMPCCIKLNEERFKLPETLISDFDICLTDKNGGEKTISYKNVHRRFMKIDVPGEYKSVKFIPKKTYGADKFYVFDFEVF